MSKGKMDKSLSTPGSRIGTLLYSLEKLNSSSSDDIEQMRYTTAKILNCTKDQEPVRKQIMSKTTNGLEILFSTLESSTDNHVSFHVVSTLVELLYTGKRASVFVSHGATQVLLAALATASRAQPVSEELMVTLHHVLSKIGPKDRKFGVKARLSGALAITFGLVRTNTANFEILQPTLQVLKIYATNSVNASYLGKSGAVNCMFRILSVCGRKHNTTLRLALDILCQLVKSKSNAARAVGQGGVTMLLTMMCDWQRNDARNRHVKIRKAILNTLKNITVLKSGKKAFIDSNGIKVLYDIAQENTASHCKELDSLVNLISVILRKCSPRNRLPVTTIKSCVPFSLPASTVGLLATRPEREGDDVIDDSDDQDDDISSSDEQKDNEQEQDGTESDKQSEVPKRLPEDLAMYEHFFRELTDYEEFLQEESDSDQETGDCQPILIPTAGSSSSSTNAHPHRTHSSSLLVSRTRPSKQLRENRLSLPNLSRMSSLVNSSTGQPLDEPQPIQTLAVNVSGIRLDPSLLDTQPEPKHSRTLCKSVAADSSNGIDMTIKGGRASFTVGNPNRSPKQATSSNRYNLRSPPKLRKLSRSLTSLKQTASDHTSRPGSRQSSKWKLDPELEETQQDTLRASMTISRMTLRTPESQPQHCVSPESDSISLDDYSSELYADLMCKTKRVLPFRRIAQPELRGHKSPASPELFFEKSPGVQRAMIFEDIDRVIHPDKVIDRVVFDLDTEVRTRGSGSEATSSSELSSDSSARRNSSLEESTLTFDSQFECGNLRKAIQVRQYEYDLLLNSDINSNHHHQWFYFEVSSMRADVQYRLNVINCEKTNSQFNYGMQPVLYSVREAMEGRPHWVRAGIDICYYKNNFARSSLATGGQKGKSYYTFAFTLIFQYTNDICYLAYHYPFTYTMMKVHLLKLEASLGEWSNIYYRNQSLCDTLGGNSCPLLTITSNPSTLDKEGVTQFRLRPYILLSSRVHPGESNSSWVMKGVLKYLLSSHPTAQLLRDTYIFKIIPMLNPDGVINGSHRCSLTGEDLNRRWDSPNPDLHPTIYHTKGLLQYLAMCSRSPLVFCDFHGHSRRKNVFMYGCSEAQSQLADDVAAINGNKQEDTSYKTLPRILNQSAPAFSLSSCSFVVEKAKEATARVVVWKELRVPRSYTMESTYCGCDQGQYKGFQITTAMLEEMGQKFCEGLLRLITRRSSERLLSDKSPSQTSLSSTRIFPGSVNLAVTKDEDDYGSPGEDVDALLQASVRLKELSAGQQCTRRKRPSNDLESGEDEEDDEENYVSEGSDNGACEKNSDEGTEDISPEVGGTELGD
ncbi:cytosolic carboxypeptidase 1-like [Patiria miniata]|uniref:tubulin-glutamate carboxypeptidase n=1 Tax=Patiria miniata TaxID=46514 RepID=A0A914BP34_PATMI|nr:cytosolic carboxypeptidase 1-like [Patiria miniata]